MTRDRGRVEIHDHPQHWTLAEDAPIFRNPPRPPEKREPGYMERYDSHTVIYDAVLGEQEIRVIGPGMRNLGPLVRESRWSLDGVEVEPSITARPKSLRVDVRLPEGFEPRAEGHRLEIDGPLGPVSLGLSPRSTGIFKGRRVLLTLQKDNDLQWIRDWLRFYAREHGVDAVLVYDNGSTAYTPEELREAIESVDQIEAGVVAVWPFKFGPASWAGVPHDSKYLQLAVMVHSRYTYLAEAVGVINADIDELAIVEGRRTLFDLMEESPDRALLYQGRWIENASVAPVSDPARFTDFAYYDPQGEPTRKKWVSDPTSRGPGRWYIHGINALKVKDPDPRVTLCHFRGISTGWKYDRSQVPLEGLVRDDVLVEVLREHFGHHSADAADVAPADPAPRRRWWRPGR
ncbi:hypothetical protein [Demequina subtropica]|uniref:hypothetical protein n=1 Tax=Demequina subtropica TaxID=1638989 RepID=UPI0012E067FB|nr:hypothetical protein [Demequina subtropica]